MKVLESSKLIRFPDCDPFNHLNNAEFITYCYNAREEQEIENYQFNIYEYSKKTNKNWVVKSNQIAYFAPAFLMETVIIQSSLLEWNPTDLLLELLMWNEDKTELKSLLWAKWVYFDLKDHKRAEHDAFLNEVLGKNANPLKEKMTFEQRRKMIRSVKA